MVKHGLLAYGHVQAGLQSIRGHLSVVAVENSEQAVLLVQVRPLHLCCASAGVFVCVAVGGTFSLTTTRFVQQNSRGNSTA